MLLTEPTPPDEPWPLDDWLPEEPLADVPDEEFEPDELLPPVAPLLPVLLPIEPELPAPLVPPLAPEPLLLPPMAPVLPVALLPAPVLLELPAAVPRLAFWSLPRLEPEPFPSFDF
ncbi:MAG: hypothetical protein ACXU8N_21930 [Telluria sp.]